jgi:cell wall-associated NlpC family hydrolase
MQTKSKSMLLKTAAALVLMALMIPSALASFKADVYSDSMEVYSSPSSSAKNLGSLKEGTEVVVTGYAGSWAKIRYRGRSGYALIKDMASHKRAQAYAKADGVCVYEDASSSSEKLGTLSAGDRVYVVGKDGNYLLVENRSGKAAGYIYKSSLSKKKPSKPSPDEPDDPDNGGDKRVKMPSGLKSETSDYDSSMSNSQKIEYIIYVAQNQLGKKYSESPNPPSTYDCAGLVRYCYEKADIKVEASAYSQGYDTTYAKVSSASKLKRGDMVCFDTNEGDSDLSDHTGIYIGSGYFIHASSSGEMVIVSNLNSGYYSRTFSWGRRILD